MASINLNVASISYIQPDELLASSPQLCPTPIVRAFYERVASRVTEAPIAEEHDLADFSGLAIDVPAGSAFSVTLRAGPQIVNAWAFNSRDPDERIWHESVIREGIFLRRYTRVWGTMARYRPLLTLLEDTVTADPGLPRAQHHPYFGGSGTPADWHYAGGSEGVTTTWEQFAGLLHARRITTDVLNEHLCLFQKSVVEPEQQRIDILPSDAVAGDRVVLYAEIDLCVLLALSPYVDGGRPASTPGLPVPRPIRVAITEQLGEPLPWPYPGISYPDMSRYLDEAGTRTTDVVPTPGIDYQFPEG